MARRLIRRAIRAGRNNAARGLSGAADFTVSTARTAIPGPMGQTAGHVLAAPNRILARIAKGKK